MAWLVILSSILVLWVGSLCKILHGSLFASKVTFLKGGVIRRRNVLLVIAHPDDESMFFAPTINYLISEGHNLHVLCMSTGDAEGKGNIRKEELYLASAILRIPVLQVKIIDHPDLQDGFGKMWNRNLLANIIDEETRAHSIDLIITFDDYGVSGHCNHRDVHQGVRKLLHVTSGRHIEVWELVSYTCLILLPCKHWHSTQVQWNSRHLVIHLVLQVPTKWTISMLSQPRSH